MTPHINAKKNEIADIVIITGDPLRAKYIAENFLENFYLVNNIRNMFIYTGIYNNRKITVASSGMGISSMGIYSYELYNFYNVKTIIRIGTSGSYDKNIKLYDIINVKSSFSESNYAKLAFNNNSKIFNSTFDLFENINKIAEKFNLKIFSGNVHSTDVFYSKNKDYWKIIKEKYNLLSVEMESFSLFSNAFELNRNAACILSISDSFIDNNKISPEDREKKFILMINLALNSIINY